jgi:hypothetical protein
VLAAVLVTWLATGAYGLVDGARLVLSPDARRRRYERGRLTRLMRIGSPDELRAVGRFYVGTGLVLLALSALFLSGGTGAHIG